MPSSTYWDWPLYFYVGTTILQMTPRYFWRCTPRKFNSLCKVHARLNSANNNNKKGASSHRNTRDKHKPIPKNPETFIDKIM